VTGNVGVRSGHYSLRTPAPRPNGSICRLALDGWTTDGNANPQVVVTHPEAATGYLYAHLRLAVPPNVAGVVASRRVVRENREVEGASEQNLG
jgi:hypothetical protein